MAEKQGIIVLDGHVSCAGLRNLTIPKGFHQMYSSGKLPGSSPWSSWEAVVQTLHITPEKTLSPRHVYFWPGSWLCSD